MKESTKGSGRCWDRYCRIWREEYAREAGEATEGEGEHVDLSVRTPMQEARSAAVPGDGAG